MATKNNRRTLITKRILKESLLELMHTKPISKITIKEICDLSDMSRSTFYLHYQDQFELLEDIEKEVLKQTFQNLQALDKESTALESIEVFLSYVKDNKSIFSILLCQAETHNFRQGITKSVQSYIQSIVPKAADTNVEQYLYSFVMHGSLSVIINWINRDFDVTANKLAGIIYHTCRQVMPS